jgi:hypothetical protein
MRRLWCTGTDDAAAAAAVEEVDDAVVMAADNATVDATTDNVAVRGD